MAFEQKADLILKGASFYCGKGISNDIDFIAIKADRILALGRDEEIEKYISEKTEIIYFDKEHLITPGLHDSHVHLIQAGLLEKYVSLTDSTSEEDAVKKVVEFAETIPEEKWVIGIGFYRMSWDKPDRPTKKSLDRFFHDRPVLLLDLELHSAWVNSKALEICGITKDTPDPPGGVIIRDENGEPTGSLVETALCLCGEYAFDFDDKICRELITLYMKKAVRLGITSVNDMTPYMTLDLSYPDIYFGMAANNELLIRVNAARNLFEDINTFLPLAERAKIEGKGMYRIPYMKQFVDGVPSSHTGFMLEDYSDKPGWHGEPMLDIEKMRDAVMTAHKYGVSVRLHSCGDASCRAALDAYEKAIGAFPESSSRHAIEHIEVTTASDIPRFAELGVVASVQPEHPVAIPTFADNCYPDRLGPDRIKYTWPFRSLLDSGAVLCGGSDCPVVNGNPFVGIYSGITRKCPDGTPEGGWNPEQKLTVKEMIDIYTSGAAYSEGREQELGTLEAGKLADIAVFDRNLLTVDTEGIPDARSCMTIVNGKIVYKD